MDNVSVIIRSVNERTLPLCERLLQDIGFSPYVVSGHPFHSTLEKSFELAIKLDKKWCLMIDADVLPEAEGITKLIDYAENNKHLFEVQAMVLDKFFGGARPAGNHLYKTSLLPKAIKFIPKNNESLRPETFVIKSMAELGFEWRQLDFLVGLHDFEQYYEDIYRKAVTHAKKHAKYIPVLQSYWERESKKDEDFKLIMSAVNESADFDFNLVLDKSFFSKLFIDKLVKHGLKEKDVLNPKIWSMEKVSEVLDKFENPKEYGDFLKLNKNNGKEIFPKLYNFLRLISKYNVFKKR